MLAYDITLAVAPYKAGSLTAWLAGSLIVAAVTDVGVVTVPAIGNATARLSDVIEGVRAWMRQERAEAVSATYGSVDLFA